MSDEKPNPHLEITLGNENGDPEARELFMSFGLLNELVRDIKDLDNIARLGLDPDLTDAVLTTVLTDRNEKGKRVEGFELPEIDIEAAEAILDWVRDHVLDFFIRRLTKTLETAQKMKPGLQGIGSSLSGSPSAASKTP